MLCLGGHLPGCCNGTHAARDGGKREERLVDLLQAAPLNSSSVFANNGLHAVSTCAQLILHLGGILHHEIYSEDQGMLHVWLSGLMVPHVGFWCFGGLFENWRCAVFLKYMSMDF